MVVGVAIEAWKNPVEAHLTHNPATCCRSVCLPVCLVSSGATARVMMLWRCCGRGNTKILLSNWC